MTLRLAMLGLAHSHAQPWAEAIQADRRAELVGAWDHDVTRGRRAARHLALPLAPDLDQLLDESDAVAICSETVRHREYVERAASRGCHILCEKPLATSLADADAIAEAVRRVGVTFMQSFPKRLDPVNHELKRLIDSGALGRIWLARVRHGHNHGQDLDFGTGWWAEPSASGGGALLDEGIHAADLLRWFFGDPASVQATIGYSALELPVEDTAIAIFHWPSGSLGEIVSGWSFQAADTSIEIYGTAGTALLSGVDLASRDFARAGPYLRYALAGAQSWSSVPCTPRFVQGGFHQQVVTTFLDCLNEGAPPPTGLAEGRGALAMILSAYQAAREGGHVSLTSEPAMQTPKHGPS